MPPRAQTFKLDHIKATGTLLLLAGVITALVYRIKPRAALPAYRDTLVQLKFTILTVASVLALSFGDEPASRCCPGSASASGSSR